MKKLKFYLLFCLMSLCTVSFAQEILELEGALKLGDTPNAGAGILKWDGSEFLGHDGSDWLSFGNYWKQSGNEIYYNDGNVGIGIANPANTLHLGGPLRIECCSPIWWYSGGTLKSFISIFNDNLTLANLVGSGHVIMSSLNDVYISGYNSATTIEIGNFGDIAMRSTNSSGAELAIYDENGNDLVEIRANESATSGSTMFLRDVNGDRTIELDADYLPDGGGQILLADNSGASRIQLFAMTSAGQGAAMYMNDGLGNQTIRIDADNGGQGGVAVLTDENANDRIRIEANESSLEGAYISMRNNSGGNGIQMHTNEGTTDGASIKLFNDNGDLAIELDAEFNDGGDGRITTDVLQIIGGSDLSENFNVGGKLSPEPGHLVSINPDEPGALMVTGEAHDKKIAGVISGANGIKTGMLMGQKASIADGDYPIALTGRVYVWANTENGKIEPGDLLTSSSTAGIAMKASNSGRSNGAIVGKAMTSLEEGTDYVLVLINLQ